MTFTINSLGQCDGGNHLTANVTVGGQSFDVHFTRDEILSEAHLDDRDEARSRALLRMISAVKEATTGVPSSLQVRNALLGKTFEV